MIEWLGIKNIGTDLAWMGAIISVIGTTFNNLYLDHLEAMLIWRFSNLILLVWSIGLWRKWWDGGLAGLALVGMYSYYSVTNEWGLFHV